MSEQPRRAQPLPPPAPAAPPPMPGYPPHGYPYPPYPYPPAPQPAPAEEDDDDEPRQRPARRERPPTAMGTFFSRTLANFIGSFFGTLFAGVALFFGLTWYVSYQFAKAFSEVKTEQDKNPPPKVSFPTSFK